MAIDYKQAGVDIDAGDSLVSWLKANQPQSWPHQERIVSNIGGFSALFRADFKEMKEPCLVSSTDGVGTKLKVAAHFSSYKTVAQDLVAMCVNDLVCCGAQPLFFLDYYATGKLELPAAKEFLGGVQSACVEADCALIGGETAEMPGVYRENDFDCAGFSVGVVDKDKVLGSHLVSEGDSLIGVESSGFHSNGFSLLRKVFADDIDNWKEELLTPTHLYVKLVQELLKHEGLNAIANITGGGMDNILRVLPKGMGFQLNPWKLPKAFMTVKERAELDWTNLLRTLNCGIGLVLVVNNKHKQSFTDLVEKQGYKSFDLGQVSQQEGWSIEAESFDREQQ